MKIYSINIINKKRAFLSLLIITLLLLFMLNLCFPTNIVTGTQQTKFITYRVEDGDTLWSIAEKYNFSDKDIRETIYEINKINQLGKNEYLIVGETIKIPVN